ncbi:MAG: hypothetical protein U0W94_00625 [Buchnera aphidicola (Schlechtendalia peitan)]
MIHALKCMELVKLEIKRVQTLKDLDKLKVKYLGKKGYISLKMFQLRNMLPQKKKRMVLY